MITFESVPVYLACGPTDLRKQIVRGKMIFQGKFCLTFAVAV